MSDHESADHPEPADVAYRQLGVAVMDLMINVGMIGSIRRRWPEDVIESWVERVGEMIEWAEQQTIEAQEFASAYDDR